MGGAGGGPAVWRHRLKLGWLVGECWRAVAAACGVRRHAVTPPVTVLDGGSEGKPLALKNSKEKQHARRRHGNPASEPLRYPCRAPI